MARVNHKLVKQRLNEQRSKISDRQFFSSRLLAGHFEDLAAAQTRRYRYNRRVRVNLYWTICLCASILEILWLQR